MPGVVSIVEGAAGEHVRSCWELLERELGLGEPPSGGIPHVSYHVSERPYRADDLVQAIERAACHLKAFEAASTGIGVFAGEPAVVYLAVTRDNRLSQLQHTIWEAAEPHCDVSFEYGKAENWVPHITLAMDGLSPELTARAVSLLLPRMQPMRFAITNVALLDELTGSHQVVRRWDFAGKVAE